MQGDDGKVVDEGRRHDRPEHAMIVVGVLRGHHAGRCQAAVHRVAVHHRRVEQPNRLEGAPHDLLDLGGRHVGCGDIRPEHRLLQLIGNSPDRQPVRCEARWPGADAGIGAQCFSANGQLGRHDAVARVVQIAPADAAEPGIDASGAGFGRQAVVGIARPAAFAVIVDDTAFDHRIALGSIPRDALRFRAIDQTRRRRIAQPDLGKRAATASCIGPSPKAGIFPGRKLAHSPSSGWAAWSLKLAVARILSFVVVGAAEGFDVAERDGPAQVLGRKAFGLQEVRRQGVRAHPHRARENFEERGHGANAGRRRGSESSPGV